MNIGPPPQCLACTRWVSPLERDDADAQKDEPTQVCAAYPLSDGGIPAEIWSGAVDHRKPHKGDHGLQWESDGTPFPEFALQAARGQH